MAVFSKTRPSGSGGKDEGIMTAFTLTLSAAPAIPDAISHPFQSFGRWFDRKLDAIALKRAEFGALTFEFIQPGTVAGLDLERLDIGHPLNCVLGQLFLSKGRSEPSWIGSGLRMGLEVSPFGSYFIGYPRLTRAWKIVGARYKSLVG
jgi:hypothetical protein